MIYQWVPIKCLGFIKSSISKDRKMKLRIKRVFWFLHRYYEYRFSSYSWNFYDNEILNYNNSIIALLKSIKRCRLFEYS